MRTRSIEGGVCAQCGERLGLILVNGKSVAVRPEAAVLGSTIVFELHVCPSSPHPAPRPPANGPPRRKWK